MCRVPPTTASAVQRPRPTGRHLLFNKADPCGLRGQRASHIRKFSGRSTSGMSAVHVDQIHGDSATCVDHQERRIGPLQTASAATCSDPRRDARAKGNQKRDGLAFVSLARIPVTADPLALEPQQALRRARRPQRSRRARAEHCPPAVQARIGQRRRPSPHQHARRDGLSCAVQLTPLFAYCRHQARGSGRRREWGDDRSRCIFEQTDTHLTGSNHTAPQIGVHEQFTARIDALRGPDKICFTTADTHAPAKTGLEPATVRAGVRRSSLPGMFLTPPRSRR